MFFTILGVIAAALILVMFWLIFCSARALGGGWRITEYSAEKPPMWEDHLL